MITLFHRAKTRATRFIFLLEELEASYTVRSVTTRTRDGGGAIDPANPHPHGKVPAIADDGVVVFQRIVTRPAYARALAKDAA
jgi:glutathione S-transferase